MGDLIDNDDYPSDGGLGCDLPQPLHFCGVREEFRVDGKLFPIPELVWTWWFDGRLPGWANDKTETVIQESVSTWSKHCRLTFRQAVTRASANVLITTETIDGDQGVLADATMYNGQRQQRLRFDFEKYVDTLRPGPGYIGFRHVTSHEWGHIILLPHLDFDGTPDLMNRTYNPDIWEPQADEASIVKKAFGAPVESPPVLPPMPHGEYAFNFDVPGLKGVVQFKPSTASCSVSMALEREGKKALLSGSKAFT